MKRVAVILSGCGVYDGAEIHEATATLLALDRAGAEAIVCAPSGRQMHVIDHSAGQPAEGENRDIQVESARIARGPVRPLARIGMDEIDAVAMPGGFGAAKNLCSFATEGADCKVHPEVEAFLREAHAAGKPLGAMCIAPVILARVFGDEKRMRLTIGSDPDTAAAITAMGAEHVEAPVTGTVVDEDCRVVTTPAYMLAGRISEVFDGVEGFVGRLLGMC